MNKKTKIVLTILIFLVVAIWANITRLPADKPASGTQVYFFDVGQGDSELIENGNTQLLIDGGPDDKVLSQLGKAMPAGDRKIEEIILTHPHADHLRGLIPVLDRYQVGKVVYSGAAYDSNGYKEFLDKIKKKNIPLVVPEVGSKEELFPGGELTYLWPGKKYENITLQNLNNVSESVKFCYLTKCVVLMGDLETDGQKEMFDYWGCHPEQSEGSQDSNSICPIKADLLKLSHHGSTNGTNLTTLDTIHPLKAVIEVGAGNTYGHPHDATLKLLQKNSIPYWRTDQDGMIQFNFTEQGIAKE